MKKEVYKVYVTYDGKRTEIASFTSKGLMHICLPSIKKTYENVGMITYTGGANLIK